MTPTLRAAALLLLLAAAAAARADETEPPERKLTFGRYALGGAAGTGTDLNLRWRQGACTLWLGAYQDGDFGRQLRAGWEQGLDGGSLLGQPLQWLTSLQLASRGFVGGSLSAQWGAPFYGQLGWGRTNLRPYANLNFDPNDAISAAVGWQGEGGRQLALSVIADDRLGTGQQHHHLTLRWPLPPGLRLTADLLHKQGQGDGGPVRAWGWSLALDGQGGWFARLARDPKQNFGVQDAWRLSGGWRF